MARFDKPTKLDPAKQDTLSALDKIIAQGAASRDAATDMAKNVKKTAEGMSRMAKTFAWMGRKISDFSEAMGWIRETPIIGHVFGGIGWAIKKSAQSYMKLWDRVVYKRDKGETKKVWGKKFGVIPWLHEEVVRPPSDAKEFSRKRAGIMLSATFLAATAMTPTTAGDYVRFFTVEPAADFTMMALTLHDDKMTLFASEEIDPVNNIHSVRGCSRDQNCSEAQAIYMRVRPRLSHDIWKFAVHGNPIYVPDHVVAPIAPGVNDCQVKSYGIRLTNSFIGRLARSLQVYPTMLEASCTNVTTNVTYSSSITDASPK